MQTLEHIETASESSQLLFRSRDVETQHRVIICLTYCGSQISFFLDQGVLVGDVPEIVIRCDASLNSDHIQNKPSQRKVIQCDRNLRH